MKNPPVKILIYDSYLASIKNSVGSKIFQNRFAKVGGKKKDILENGQLSCAIFVSGILKIFDLISETHATISGLTRDLEKSGWEKINKPKPGSIIIWDYKKYDGGSHMHSGFYIGNNKAISNSTEKGFPVEHHWTYGGRSGKVGRKIISIYWNKKLKN